MRPSKVVPALLIAALPLLATARYSAEAGGPSPDKQAAVEAASAFGEALKEGDSDRLRPLLPAKGKVYLRLLRMGPEQGSYSPGQVLTLLDDFLRQGAVHSFRVVRAEDVREGYAMIRGRSRILDREGRTGEIDLHLTFEPERDRWILREIRETSP